MAGGEWPRGRRPLGICYGAEMKAREILGKRIRELRKKQGLSMEALAVEAGMNDKYLGSVERGQQAASIDTIEKVATGLGVTPHELLLSHEQSARELRTRISSLSKSASTEQLRKIVAVLEALLH